MEDGELRKIARKRVEFKRHLTVYIVAIVFLGLINLFTSRHFPWFLFPAMAWGIGVVFHFLFTYGFMGDTLDIEREYQRLKNKISGTLEKLEKKDVKPGINNFEEKEESFASKARQINEKRNDYFKTTRVEKIIRTKRKTIALQITDDAKLIARVPFGVNDEAAMRVIVKHKKWIEKKQSEIETKNAKFSPKEFVNGEEFLYLGNYFKLQIVDKQEIPLRFKGKFCFSKNALPRARELFIDWYKKIAYEKISERVTYYARKKGLTYNLVNITNAKKRWGSASSHGNLNFPWRLIMAPLSVVDYVAIHELVHLEERNHTKVFWSKVKMVMPEYEKQEYWLKENDYLLRL